MNRGSLRQPGLPTDALMNQCTQRLGRRWLLADVNPDAVAISEARLLELADEGFSVLEWTAERG